MCFKQFYISFLFFFSISVFSQDESLFVANTIPLELKVKANAVIRYNDVEILVEDYNKMTYTNTRVVTVFNEYGNRNIAAYMLYNDNRNIKHLEARIFDEHGNEIKKIKEKDFNDTSAVPGGTLYSNNRLKSLEYTPVKYPYTILVKTEVDYKTTAFIPGWSPIEGYYVSTENSEYRIVNESGIEIKTNVTNFNSYNIEKINDFHYKGSDLMSIAPEAYSPSFNTLAPKLKVALTEFDMEGVRGVNTSWSDFGQWMNDYLISGTQELPQTVKDEIKALTATAESDLEKAKIVYEFMQNKTRYISVQVGIGGWKPMLASDVDRLGYGDCKALTNYTKALLTEVGVESYYTVIYGGRDIINMDQDFSVTEGNHVILSLPYQDDYLWLECTSQTNPFGHIANFTDDRDALIITPEGGEIVHTKVYKDEENLLKTSATVHLDETGNFQADVVLESYGTQYDSRVGLQHDTQNEQEYYYKDYWSYINNLKINSKTFENNKDTVVFKETLKLEASKYGTKAGNIILLQPNFFNRVTSAPPRYKTRNLPFEVDRGFVDVDKFVINFPETIEVEAIQDDVSISNKFGEYSLSVTKMSDNRLVFNRKFMLKKGSFEKEDYKDFRAFWLSVIKYDKSKIALKQKI